MASLFKPDLDSYLPKLEGNRKKVLLIRQNLKETINENNISSAKVKTSINRKAC